MKNLAWMPIGVVFAAIAATLILRGVTGDPHAREVTFAAVIALVAGTFALLPLVLRRTAPQAEVFQAALIGTLIHMFLMFVMGAAAFALRLVGQRNFFLFLLLGFYWVTLMFIVTAMIKAVRRAPAEPPAAPSSGHGRTVS